MNDQPDKPANGNDEHPPGDDRERPLDSTVELAAGTALEEQAERARQAALAEAEITASAARGGIRRWLLGGHGATAWLWLTALIILLDRLSKMYIIENYEYARPVMVNEWLDITRLHNYGAAFSFLADAGGWQHTLFITLALVVSLVLFVWLWRLPSRGQSWLACALALVLGGALGNVIDRVSYGYVVDFIHAHWQDLYWPAFNVADMAISIGAVMLVLESFVTREQREKAATRPDA